MSELNPYLEIARLVAASIVGALSGAFAAHKLTGRRERESGTRTRLREFRAFVTQFRSEAADRYHPPNAFAEFYQNKIPNLRHAAATVREDFRPERRAEFDRLVAVAAGFTGAQADEREIGKQRIVNALDDILRFLNT